MYQLKGYCKFMRKQNGHRLEHSRARSLEPPSCRAPCGAGAPLFPLVHLLPHLFPFLLFPFSHWLYRFSSFVHPFPFYQNSPTPFPGQAAAWTMILHYYEDEAVRRRRPAGRCMLDNIVTQTHVVILWLEVVGGDRTWV